MDTLVQVQAPLKSDEGFTGFEEDDQEATPIEDDKSDDETESRTEEDLESSMGSEKSASLSNTLQENDMKLILDRLVDKLTPVLQTLCVTDRVAKAERNAEEWKTMANLIMSNPQFATSKMSIGPKNEGIGLQKASMLGMGRHPMEQTWEMFIQTPLATPMWTLILKLDLHPTSSTFTRWWKKIRSDTRNDTWCKLSKYLQSVRYFNNASDEFWRKYAVNPTYFSIQRLSTELVTQANWLKASGLELQKVIDKYFDAAADIASSSGTVGDIDHVLVQLWPANFKPHRLHYENEPFLKATLFAQEDENLCDNTAQLKGFKFTQKPSNSAASAMPTMIENGEQAETPRATKAKFSTVSKLIEEILNNQK